MALHSGYIHGDLGTGGSSCHSSCRCLSDGKMKVSTAPHKPHPGVHSHPSTVGSLSSEAQCMHCNSNHTLCKSWWRSQDSIVEHRSHPDTPQRAGPCLDLDKKYSCSVNHSFHTAHCMTDKHGCHLDSVQESRWYCRCPGESEQGRDHKRNRRRDLCYGRSGRRSDIFYKLFSLHSIQKGSWEHSGPPVADAGCVGTSGRCCHCCVGQPHSVDTEDGSQHSIP